MDNDSTPWEYVKLAEIDLPRIQLEHLTSAIDMSISLPEALVARVEVITGYTEWIGRWHKRDLSIGWDWAFADEAILLIHADEIRSNVQIIHADGVPASAVQTRIRLATWIETLPWRDGAVTQLIQRNRRPCF